MALTVQQMRPVAHVPVVLGVLRRLEVATVIDHLITPHPAHVLSTGRGVDALVLAMLDGDQALYKVGQRLEERGMMEGLQAGLPRASLHDDRLGHIRDALFAAKLNKVYSAIARKALAGYTLATPWLHQDPTTMALQGAQQDEPKTPRAPRPAYGQSKDGRADLKQGLLRLGVRGAGGLPLRLGMRDGNTSDRGETLVAIEACRALGLQDVPGIVAESKAQSCRTFGLCQEKGLGLVTLVPRPCAVRQKLEAWGAQQAARPLLVEQPGRTKDEACRQWHGQSVLRAVEVEDSEGRVTQKDRRLLVVPSSQLAQQPTPTHARAQAKEAEALTDHVQRVPARWFACEADAAAAMAEQEHHAPGRRGRRPHPWRSHAVRQRVGADTRRTRRARRGRPAKSDPRPLEGGYRLVVNGEARANPEAANGGMVLAPTVHAEVWSDTAMLKAYQDQNTTGEPGVRWIKKPAAIAPVWLEKPERIAALAMLTVVGLLVYSLIQRQVRLQLHTHNQQSPGNKGLTAPPTAAVV